MTKKKSSLLGDYPLSKQTFPHLDSAFKEFKKIKGSQEQARSDAVNRTLLDLIQKEEEPCFLLSAVLDFI